MDVSSCLAQSVDYELLPLCRSRERLAVILLADYAAIVDLCSPLGGGWKDEFGVREGCLNNSVIWDFGRERWRPKCLHVGAAAVDDIKVCLCVVIGRKSKDSG